LTAPARRKSSAATSSACVYPSFPRCACAACLTWFAAAVCADACALPERSARHARPQSLAPPPFLPQKALQDHRDRRCRGPLPAHALFPSCALLLVAPVTIGACARGQDIIFALAASGVCVAFRRGAQGPFESSVRASLPSPIQGPRARRKKQRARGQGCVTVMAPACYHFSFSAFLCPSPCLFPARPDHFSLYLFSFVLHQRKATSGFVSSTFRRAKSSAGPFPMPQIFVHEPCARLCIISRQPFLS